MHRKVIDSTALHRCRTGNSWTPGEVLGVFYSVATGAQSLGIVAPGMQGVVTAKAAAKRLFQVFFCASQT